MIDQAKASRLAKEGFDQWQAGQHEQSRLLYEQAIPLADPQHYGLPGYYGEYACVLNHLGQDDGACTAMEKSLETELAQGNAEGSLAVIVARYFLADQLRRLGHHERALDTLSPSIEHAPGNWLTRVAEAHILHAMGRTAEARAAAGLAIANAPTPEKAAQLKENLRDVLGDPDMQV